MLFVYCYITSAAGVPAWSQFFYSFPAPQHTVVGLEQFLRSHMAVDGVAGGAFTHHSSLSSLHISSRISTTTQSNEALISGAFDIVAPGPQPVQTHVHPTHLSPLRRFSCGRIFTCV